MWMCASWNAHVIAPRIDTTGVRTCNYNESPVIPFIQGASSDLSAPDLCPPGSVWRVPTG